MESDLLEALRERFGGEQAPTGQHHYKFGASNRGRAKTVCEQIKAHTSFVFRERRVLDVGCAYGGFVILAAKLGASAWGVEIDSRLHNYGLLNARGEPGDIHLFHGDFLDPAVLGQLPTDFDLVLVNDVFEHVYNTARLVAHLNRVLKDGGRVVFAIPNGEALEFVGREGHLLRPGLTLLAPNAWHHAVHAFSVYYRPWSHFVGLFRAFGLGDIQLWNATPQLALDEMAQQAALALEQARAAIGVAKFTDGVTRTMLRRLEDLRRRVDADVEYGDPRVMHWKYFVAFWQGTAMKTGPIGKDVDRFY